MSPPLAQRPRCVSNARGFAFGTKQDAACVQVAESKHAMPDSVFGMFHDMLVTENYYILLENPTRINAWKLLTQYTTGKACIAECLYMDKTRPLKVRASPLFVSR